MLSQLAEQNRWNGNYDEAIKYLRKAIAKNGSEPKHHTNLGRLLITQGKIREAQIVFEEALTLEPASPDVLHNLSILGLRLQEREKSQEYIERIMELDIISSSQYMVMGDDLVTMHEHKLAIPFYEKCLQVEPKNSSALVNLATCYAELGMYESAIIGYRSALVLNPEDSIIIRNLLTMKKVIENNVVSNDIIQKPQVSI